MTTLPYPGDWDVAWAGSDQLGQIAAFVTGGEGPIPKVLLSSLYPPVEDTEKALLQLPVLCEAILREGASNPESFAELARRGLFVYDWTDVHRTNNSSIGAYELVASPAKPLLIGEMPENAAQLAALTRFNELRFGAGELVKMPTLLDCVTR